MPDPESTIDRESRPDLGELANRVLAGRELTEPLRINDFIFESPDLSSSFLVTTDDGDVIINTGATANGPRHRARFETVSHAPVRYVILTQSHIDHISGVADLRTDETLVVAQQRFHEIAASRRMLADFWQGRKDRLLKAALGESYSIESIDLPQPDITYEHQYSFQVGGRRFELIHAPGGEALDGSLVWLPKERILFTGNMFGPIIGHLPNLYTIRGERIRSAAEFVRCVDLTLELYPELVVEGHANGEPLDGASFRERAMRVRDAVAWLLQAVVAGMNSGKDVWTLMRELRLPAELAVPETHGKLAWCVRAIWEEYVGWFHYDSTTSLYDVRPSSVHPDIVELCGGTGRLVQRAELKLAAGQPLEALHLVEIVLGAEPAQRDALELSRQIHQQLLDASGRENFFETFWLQSCVVAAESGPAGRQ